MTNNVLDVVYELNLDFFELTKNSSFTPFTLSSSGLIDEIYFMGHNVYNSDDSNMLTEEETGELIQTVKEYCVQEAKKVLNSLLPILNWS